MHEGFNYECGICGEFVPLEKRCSFNNKWWHIPVLGKIINGIKNARDNLCM